MDLSKPFPDIPSELLARLEAQFPDRFPDPHLTTEELWMKGGEVRLVRFLRHKHEEQNGRALRKP